MSQDTLGQVMHDTSIEESEVSGITESWPDTEIPPNGDASKVIVQRLLIAPRRGRQIRLARIGGAA